MLLFCFATQSFSEIGQSAAELWPENDSQKTVGCYIWYSEKGTGRGRSPPRTLLAVPNVTAQPSMASVPITVPLLCGFNVVIKGLNVRVTAVVGVGIGYIVLNALVAIYYNVIIAKALYYIFGSFTSELPWASCGHDWNTDDCRDTSRRYSS